MELTAQLLGINGCDLQALLETMFRELPTAEVEAALVIEYTRKGALGEDAVWPDNSPYRSAYDDHYILRVEVRVPVLHSEGEFAKLVNRSKDALAKAQADRLDARKAALEAQIAELEEQRRVIG